MLAYPDGRVYDTVWWDPDGIGPQDSLLVFGGEFQHLGSVAEFGLAAWNPATNTFVVIATDIERASVFSSPIWALEVLSTGDLVVGGSFTSLSGQAIANVARFDGSNWYPLGGGLDGEVHDLAVTPNGDLIAAGLFANAGTTPAIRIARWDGAAWHAMGTPNGLVERLASAPNGDLIAAGRFGGINGVLVNRIARWNGSIWSPLGSGLGPNTLPPAAVYTPSIKDLDVLANGDVLTCGAFTTASGIPVNGSARWDGSNWFDVNSGGAGGTTLGFSTFYIASTGALFGVTAQGVLCERSTNGWTVKINPLSTWGLLTELPTGELFAAPEQLLPTRQVLMPEGTDGAVNAVALRANGELILAGEFTQLDGVAANGIARDTGSGWLSYGNGVASQSLGNTPRGQVRAVLPLPGGQLIVGGYFDTAGTTAARHIARWDGAAWTAMGSNFMQGPVDALLQMPDGTIVAGGHFDAPTLPSGWGKGIAQWTGSSWVTIGNGVDGIVYCLACLPNGDLVAGGILNLGNLGPYNLARWDGQAWTAMANSPWTGSNRVTSLLVMTNGTLVAAGINNGPTQVATWDGSTWTTIGTASGNPLTMLSSLHELPNGDLLVGGLMIQIDTVPCRGLARWNGANWTSENAAIDNGWDQVKSMTWLGANLLVAGDFHEIGGSASGFRAYLDTTCPATATPFGSSCVGSGTLHAERPWLGSRWQLHGDNLPSPAFIFAAHGPATNLQLASLIAQGVPGCALLVQPDFVDVGFAAIGSVAFAHDIPNTPALVGATLHSQMIPFAVDHAGNLVTVTSTNALLMTLGTF